MDNTKKINMPKGRPKGCKNKTYKYQITINKRGGKKDIVLCRSIREMGNKFNVSKSACHRWVNGGNIKDKRFNKFELERVNIYVV